MIDLDGVLTDFSKQLCKLLNKPLDRKYDFGNNPKIWKKIDEAGEEYWATMKWMPDGHELWNYVKKYKPTILTAPSRHESSKKGKRVWLRENLPKTPYIIDEDKSKHAKKDYILIDDRKKNIDKWEKAGGIGILHKSAKGTIKKLKNILGKKEASMNSIIARLDGIAEKLKVMGRTKEALHLDKIADKFEEFMEKERRGLNTPDKMFPAHSMKKHLWGSGDKRLQIVKEVMDNILRRRKGTHIPQEKMVDIENALKELRKASVTEFTSQAQIDEVKKSIINKIFGIDDNLSELIGLLFMVPSNKMERMHNENEINRIAKPFLIPKYEDPLKSDRGFGRSRIFYEMSRRANEIDLSGLSDEHAQIVNACLERVISIMEKK